MQNLCWIDLEILEKEIINIANTIKMKILHRLITTELKQLESEFQLFLI